MTTDEALADAQWRIDHDTRPSVHDTRPSVETTIALMNQIIEGLCRKLVNAELQQQTTEDRVTSALDSLATWRQRAERAELENRKLRDAWPGSNVGSQYPQWDATFQRWFIYRSGRDKREFFVTRDEAINAAAGIGTNTKEGE